jgi:hypothetical protein
MASRIRTRMLAATTTAALALGGTLVAVAPVSATTPTITDANLSSCISTEFGSLQALLNSILSLLTPPSLTCVGDGIASVAGLQQAGGLSTLDLRNNSISSILDLAGLGTVGTLKLDGNGVSDLSSLAGLRGLLGLVPSTISALNQAIALPSSDAGVPVPITFPKGLDGTEIVPTVDTVGGSVAGIVDAVHHTVTWAGSGTGILKFSNGSNFTGTLSSLVLGVPKPVVTGNAAVGNVLTATGDAGTYGYQWKRAGVAIPGATTLTYSLVAADVGQTLTITGSTKILGLLPTSSESEATHTVLRGTIGSAPVPTVSGATSVGSALTASAGAWTTGVALTYQWKRAGHAIPGATSASYTIAAADSGSAMTVAVTGALEGYSTLVRTSAATPVVTAPMTQKPTTTTTTTTTDNAAVLPSGGPVVTGTTSKPALKRFMRTPAPKIVGTAKSGKKLSVKVGTWSKRVTFAYQWKANGTKIAAATHKTLIVTKKLVGKKLTVSITARLAGYVPATKSSATTKRVAV